MRLIIDEALLRAGFASDRALHRAGGPAPETMRILRREGRALRRDAVERLARMLARSPRFAARLVDATIAQVRAGGGAS